MIFSIICALSNNGVIGQGLDIPWYLPNDFKYFKKITEGYPIVMGRNTWDSLPKKPLPNRLNVIISRTLEYDELNDNVIILPSIEAMYEYFDNKEYDTVFIIGGGEIYKQMIGKVDELYLTNVGIDLDINDNTVLFPTFNSDNYCLVYSEHNSKDEKHKYEYIFNLYRRK